MSSAVDFSKKSIVFVTGASKGIGRTIAVELAKNLNEKSVFVLLARSQVGLEEAKQEILEVKQSFTVLTYVVDLSIPDSSIYTNILDKVLASIDHSGIEYGYIFHNAGHVGTLKETTELTDLKVWQDYYNLNFFSAVLLNNVFFQKLHPLVPKLVVINITSLLGRAPFANMAMYGSGKAARELFFKVLAVERPEVVVLNYSPGPVLTEMFNSICDTAEDAELRKNFTETREKSVLTTGQTVGKLLVILQEGKYKSGDTVDYFDTE